MDLHNRFTEILNGNAKTELAEVINKRFTTSFIGSLSSIEEYFYDLFNEEDWNQYWPPLRENILNKANREKRLALKELDKYEFRKLSAGNRVTKQREDKNFNK